MNYVTKRLSVTRLLASACLLAFSSYATPSAADLLKTVTAEERAACTPDVFRLCSSALPSVSGVVACMKRNRSNLSAACSAAVDARLGKQTATRSIGVIAAN
jgi:hypothetical protein